MTFIKRLWFIVLATFLSVHAFPSVTDAEDSFWIRKGTSTGAPNRTIRKTIIKPAKKTVTKKEPVAAEADTDLNIKSPVAATPALPAKEEPNETSMAVADPVKSSVVPSANRASEATPSDGPYIGVTYSDPVKQKWRVGVVLVTGSNPVKDVFTYIPIPREWPEQSVAVFEEDIPVEFAVQKIDELDGLDRLILRGRLIPPKKKIVALQTFMVTTARVNAPPDTTIFTIPDSKEKLAKKFTASGADISYRNNALRKQAEELIEAEGTAWQKVERIFDWVRENIDQGGGDPYGTITTFAKKSGHPEDVVGLFIAMCRANKIPARMVFVDGTQYAEFMLADPAGKLHWFPCDIVGIRAFGKIVEPKVILQKGDNIRVPGVKRKKKFVAAYGEVKSATAPKLMQFVREPLSD